MKNGSRTQTSESDKRPSSKKMNTRNSQVPPAPSSFDALVSPPQRIRHSIADTPQIPSFVSPGQFSSFRKQSNRARSPGPRPSTTSWQSAKASGQKKLETVSDETLADEEEDESNFQKRMNGSISPPPLGNGESPRSPGRQATWTKTNGQIEKSDIPPPPSTPWSPSEGSDEPTESRGRKSYSPQPPPSFRSVASPGSLRGRRSIAVTGGSVSGSDGPGAQFRKRESMSPVKPKRGFLSTSGHGTDEDGPSNIMGRSSSLRGRRTIEVMGDSNMKERASSLRGRRSIAVTGGSVSGSDGPGAQFRKRESMSPVKPKRGFLSTSGHGTDEDGPSNIKGRSSSLRGRRSIAVTGGFGTGTFSSFAHESTGAKFGRRGSVGSLQVEKPVAAKFGRRGSVGSLRVEKPAAASSDLSLSAHDDGPSAKSKRRESLSSETGKSAGSERGRKSKAVSGGLSSRDSSVSPSVSPERRKSSSTRGFLSTSDHGPGEDKDMATPPSGGRKLLAVPEQRSRSAHGTSRLRQSIAMTSDMSTPPSGQKSRSAHGTSRLRQSIAITNDMSSRLSDDSFDALVTPVQRGKKSLRSIMEQDIPSFATPRGQMAKGRKWTSTYLDKPMGGPRGAVKKSNRELSPIRMSHHSGSYMDKSPGGFNTRMSFAAGGSSSPVRVNQHGGSYMNKSSGGFNSRMSMSPGTLSRKSISQIAMVAPPSLDETPEDITIQVTIPDIELRIKARKEQKRKAQEYSVPEHIRKYREREQRVRTVQEEKEYRQRELAVAMIYGWAARVKFKKMKLQRDMKLAKIAKEKAIAELRDRSALKVQTSYRRYVKRKRYLHVVNCRRRRAKNAKHIKKIEKRLAKIPKETSNELKNMKKDFVKKKKEMKKEMKKLKVNDAEQQNQNLIEYLREENRKLKEVRHSIQTDHSMLQKQFGLLEKKSAEIDKRFKSLKKFVVHKNESIQKTEATLQKCRNKYVPNHRKELARRNLYCATEITIKEMYQRRLGRILDEVNTVAKERELRKDAKRASREVKRELAKIPVLETPQELKELLEELDWTRKY